MVWYSHVFQNFPQFIVIHTVKGFGIVNKAEIDVFLELSCFFDDPLDVGDLISGSSAFSNIYCLYIERQSFSSTFGAVFSQLSEVLSPRLQSSFCPQIKLNSQLSCCAFFSS